MKLLFASQNRHKEQELATLLLPHSLQLPADLDLDFDFEETESTFVGNALGKALHLHKLTNKPVIADDSGVVVDVLGGAPGIYSARYGSDLYGRELTATEKNQLLLEALANVPLAKRTARFVCAMALVLSPYRHYIVQETVEGYIATSPYGEGGFGYDPVFLVGETGTSMAQLTIAEKNSLSHRARAARKIVALLQTIEGDHTYYVC